MLICINGCAGYEPIFSSSNLQFKITDYVIKGDNKKFLHVQMHDVYIALKPFVD